jgi:DNA-binding NarL/FixJ family response regulator
VAACLAERPQWNDPARPAFASIVRCIVLGNVISRRLSGQVGSRQRQSDVLAVFLRNAVRRVATCYIDHGPAWRELAHGEITREKVDELAALLRRRMSPARLAAIGAEADEAVHDVLIRIRDGVLMYPFDMPLPQWLEMQLVRAAWAHSAYTPGRRDVAELTDAVVQGSRSSTMRVAYENDPAAWELSIDMQMRIRKLDPLDLTILRMRLASMDRHEIAAALKITPKTVSNHWTGVLDSLRLG